MASPISKCFTQQWRILFVGRSSELIARFANGNRLWRWDINGVLIHGLPEMRHVAMQQTSGFTHLTWPTGIELLDAL